MELTKIQAVEIPVMGKVQTNNIKTFTIEREQNAKYVDFEIVLNNGLNISGSTADVPLKIYQYKLEEIIL